VSRERWLILYCLIVGLLGWTWVLLSGPGTVSPTTLLLFLTLALLVEGAGFRVPPADSHSLVGIVLLTAALALGPANGALIAALSGLIFGAMLPWIYGRAQTFYLMVARPLLRSGVRAIAILLGSLLATAISGPSSDQFTLLVVSAVCYTLITQFSRVLREFLQGGRSGVITWWRSAWRSALSAEVAPLPVAALAAAIYEQLGSAYFVLAGAALLATSLTVRRAALNLQSQRRSVRELARLNEVSRAIIRSELNVEALCELIYRETSKLVDTSSFHLGLFNPLSDTYMLVVRVQDRVRLPPLTVELPTGDGIVGWMRETGRSLLVEDFTTEMNRLPARPRYQSDRPPRSGIYVPLIAGDAVIGSISIQSYRPRAFDAEDMRMLSLIADQAAVAIAKARVYSEARQRAIELQALHDVSDRITAILDLDELLPSVVKLIQEHFGYHPVHIFTIEEGDTLVFRASTAEGAALERVRRLTLHEGSGIIGTAAARGQLVLVDDVRQDPRHISDDPHTRTELAVPLRFGDQNIGVLDVQSAEIGRFSERDLSVIQTLADQIATAIESARAFTAQREEAWTLNALLQVAENTARANSLDELLPGVVRLPPLLLGCDRCYCLLWDRDRAALTPLAAYGLTAAQRAHFVGNPFGEAEAPLLAETVHSMAPATLDQAQSRITLCPPILEPFGGGALLVLPLTTRGTALGLLVADYDDPEQRFTTREMTLYSGIANQSAVAIESVLLALEADKAARLEGELRVARDIQTALLPASVPNIAGWDIAADWRSARLVGGDFYDFWRLQRVNDHRPAPALASDRQLAVAALPSASPDRPVAISDEPAADLGFVIADVSDKGVAAAMFMALSRSLVRAAALDGSSPALALTRANRWITRDSESGMFVTLFYGILQPESGVLRYTCAGHNPPLLFRRADAAVIELTTPGIALGVLEEVVLGEATVTLAAGDLLVCYTDGVTEAVAADDEPFDVKRLIQAVLEQRAASAAEVLSAITERLAQFTDSRAPFDDITLVVLKRT
jgi:serine phosphatase RsbU (regulator of sigma subunit)/putative methionine-R-sulfoxide reductase with GAF domain